MFGFLKKAAPHPCVHMVDHNTFKVRILTHRRKEVVELRFSKSSDISRDDEGGYIYRKTAVSTQFFDRAEVTIVFNSKYQVKSLNVLHGEAIPVAQWQPEI